MKRTFRHLPSRPGTAPTPREAEVYEVARQHLAAVDKLPRLLAVGPGVAAVAVVESVDVDGGPCVGLAVELAQGQGEDGQHGNA